MGGAELLTAAQASLIRRAATFETQLEQFEGTLSLGGEIDLDLYGRTAGHLRRVLETLGIEHKAKTIMPSLREYAGGPGQMTTLPASARPALRKARISLRKPKPEGGMRVRLKRRRTDLKASGRVGSPSEDLLPDDASFIDGDASTPVSGAEREADR